MILPVPVLVYEVRQDFFRYSVFQSVDSSVPVVRGNKEPGSVHRFTKRPNFHHHFTWEVYGFHIRNGYRVSRQSLFSLRRSSKRHRGIRNGRWRTGELSPLPIGKPVRGSRSNWSNGSFYLRDDFLLSPTSGLRSTDSSMNEAIFSETFLRTMLIASNSGKICPVRTA